MRIRVFLFLAVSCLSLVTAEAQSRSLKKRPDRSYPHSAVNDFLSEREGNDLYKSALKRVLRELRIENPQAVILLIDNIDPRQFTSLGMRLMSEGEMREGLKRGERVVYLQVQPFEISRSKALFSILNTMIHCPGPKDACDRISQSFQFHYQRVTGRMRLIEMLPVVLS
jgi:hypothetical protein